MQIFNVNTRKVIDFALIDGHRVHWIKQDEIPVGGFTQQEFRIMQKQIADDDTHVVIYELDQEGNEKDDVKFMARVSQILYIA